MLRNPRRYGFEVGRFLLHFRNFFSVTSFSFLFSRFKENLLPFHPEIVKCMFRALNSSQSSLRKRAVQMVSNFLSFEDTYTSLLAFVKDRFEKVLIQAGLGMQSGQAQPSQEAEELTISYFKIALQCLVALA